MTYNVFSGTLNPTHFTSHTLYKLRVFTLNAVRCVALRCVIRCERVLRDLSVPGVVKAAHRAEKSLSTGSTRICYSAVLVTRCRQLPHAHVEYGRRLMDSSVRTLYFPSRQSATVILGCLFVSVAAALFCSALCLRVRVSVLVINCRLH